MFCFLIFIDGCEMILSLKPSSLPLFSLSLSSLSLSLAIIDSDTGLIYTAMNTSEPGTYKCQVIFNAYPVQNRRYALKVSRPAIFGKKNRFIFHYYFSFFF